MRCLNCGRELLKKPGAGRSPKYCSPKCMGEYRKRAVSPKYSKICAQCGTEFQTNYKSQKYCSTECGHEAHRGRTVYTKICLYCGKEFTTIHPKYRYCSSTCGSRHAADQRRGEYFCEYCGKPRYSDHPGRTRYCSVECARKAQAIEAYSRKKEHEAERQAAHIKVCPQCKRIFVAEFMHQQYCSSECRTAMNDNIKRERAVEAYIPRSFVCAECGKLVTTEYGHTRTVYCSDECMNKAMKRDCKENRKRQMETAFVEPVWLWKTYERYDGICAICGLPVPTTKARRTSGRQPGITSFRCRKAGCI